MGMTIAKAHALALRRGDRLVISRENGRDYARDYAIAAVLDPARVCVEVNMGYVTQVFGRG